MAAKRLKNILLKLLYYSGAMGLSRFLNRHKAVVLVYHGVSKGAIAGPLRNSAYLHIGQDDFRQQMRYLKKNYNIISLQNLCGIIKKGEKIPDYTAVVTFDDGYGNFFDNAYPVLREYGIPCCVFLTSSLMRRGGWLWLDKLEYALNAATVNHIGVLGETFCLENERLKAGFLSFAIRKLKAICEDERNKLLDEMLSGLGVNVPGNPCDEYRLLSYSQARQMDETLVSFGSHTPEHTILTLERQEKVKSLVAQSKTEISQELGKDIVLFSYPNGSYDNRIKEAVRECGFICGLTTDYGSNGPGADLLELKRIPIGSGDTLVSFVAGLSGIRRYASGLISLLRRLKRARHG